MDPLTASLNLATAALALATKIWDATPAALQAQSAGDWAKFIHGLSAFILDIQAKIDAAAGVKQ
jgi:hypothetical protein